MSGALPGPLAGAATLHELGRTSVAAVLHADAGMAAPTAARIDAALRACAVCLADVAPDRAVQAFFVPGRIEVLGKHTDYAGGRSLVCAVDRGFAAVAAARADRRLTVRSADGNLVADLVLDVDLPAAPGHWTDYVRTVARRLARDFDHATGMDLAFASDLPPAAGLSSSSALVITLLLAMAATSGLEDHPRWRRALPDAAALAGYAAAVENGLAFGALPGGGGVGTLGGSQDHVAILCARPGALTRAAFAPVRLEGTVRLPADRAFVIASSGVRAEKTGAALESYNALSRRAAQAAALWRERTGRADPHLGAVLDAGLADELLRTLHVADRPDLCERAQQFVEEAGTLIPAAQRALEDGDVARFGTVVARSQELAERLLHNQIPETIDLVHSARDLGADAASAFGAGFGGSVWALVPNADAHPFAALWRRAYVSRFPAHADAADFFVTPAGPAAVRIA